jgi:hypothetical protein
LYEVWRVSAPGWHRGRSSKSLTLLEIKGGGGSGVWGGETGVKMLAAA